MAVYLTQNLRFSLVVGFISVSSSVLEQCYWLKVTVTGLCLTKHPIKLRLFLICCAPHLSYNHS
jgi:hypothetical protein